MMGRPQRMAIDSFRKTEKEKEEVEFLEKIECTEQSSEDTLVLLNECL